MAIGENIKRIRKEKGLTQKALGERCNISEGNIRKYESNRQKPKIETIQRIANALGVSEYELQGISTKEIVSSLSTTATFFSYLQSIGYEVQESPYNNDWVIHVTNTGEDITLSSEELDALEYSTKENIDLKILKLIRDRK